LLQLHCRNSRRSCGRGLYGLLICIPRRIRPVASLQRLPKPRFALRASADVLTLCQSQALLPEPPAPRSNVMCTSSAHAIRACPAEHRWCVVMLRCMLIAARRSIPSCQKFTFTSLACMTSQTGVRLGNAIAGASCRTISHPGHDATGGKQPRAQKARTSYLK
jgi:hypothetical protein